MIYTLENEQLVIKVKSLGSELTSIYDKKANREIMYQGDPKYWSGQSPILFPIIGGLIGDKYTYKGKEYHMDCSHGFARKMEFGIVNQTDSSLTFKLSDNESTLAMYPFKFDLYLIYTVVGCELMVGYRVVNKNDYEMIFTIGGHPAFACNGEFTDYYLEFEKAEQINSRKKGQFLTGEEYLFLDNEKTVNLKHELFYNGAIILKDMASNWIKLKNKLDNLCIKFTFADFTHFGIWSAANDGPYVCLEPWYGVDPTIGDSDIFSQKEGILRLDALSEFNSEYSITID